MKVIDINRKRKGSKSAKKTHKTPDNPPSKPGWETGVDLAIEQLNHDMRALTEWSHDLATTQRQLSYSMEDLFRDMQDTQRALRALIKGLKSRDD